MNNDMIKYITRKIMEKAFELGYLPDYENNHMFDLQDSIREILKECL